MNIVKKNSFRITEISFSFTNELHLKQKVILLSTWLISNETNIDDKICTINDSNKLTFFAISRRRSSGWKVGARNALLQWCKEIITPRFGIHVENFGSSWRDGRAFVALISALNPGKLSFYLPTNSFPRVSLWLKF